MKARMGVAGCSMITMAHIQVTRRELLHDDANDYRQSFFRQRVTCDIQVPPITHTRISCFPEELLEAGHIFLPKIPFDRSCDENSHQLKGLRFTILVHTECGNFSVFVMASAEKREAPSVLEYGLPPTRAWTRRVPSHTRSKHKKIQAGHM